MDAISSDHDLKDLESNQCHMEPFSHLAKLPLNLKLIVNRNVSDSNLDMNALLATIEEEMTAREKPFLHLPDEVKRNCITLPLLYFLVPKNQGVTHYCVIIRNHTICKLKVSNQCR